MRDNALDGAHNLQTQYGGDAAQCCAPETLRNRQEVKMIWSFFRPFPILVRKC